MPIRVGTELRRMEDEEFKTRTYEAMRHVFDVHRDLGRLFNEKVYQRELARRIPDAQREVPIALDFDAFCKTYFLDLLVGGGAILELKAVDSLADRHKRQLMQYLFLTDMPHGKLVKLRPDRVEHEFINNVTSVAARTSFAVVDDRWQEIETRHLRDGMIAVLRDWGVGLDITLYEEVGLYLCDQSANVESEVAIHLGDYSLGVQRMCTVAPAVALRTTALPPDRFVAYRDDLNQLLEHTDLRAIQWINITQPVVHFMTISKRR